MDEGDRSESDDGPTERTEPVVDSVDGAEGMDDVDDVDDVDETNSVTETDPNAPTADGEFDGDFGEPPHGSVAEHRSSEAGIDADKSLLYRFRHDREGALMWLREMLSSVAIVFMLGLLLFGVSGVWPPMVAVESGSMEPNMEVGDLVFVTDPGRLAPDAANNDVGVVTHEVGEEVDYRTFGSYGSVVIYRPPGRTASPIIHRAMFHVEEGENWYERADDRYHNAVSCGDLNHCPAPHDGYITLGDNNSEYDQANGLAAPVRAEWVTGVARVRVPYLGYVRLIATGQAEFGDVLATAVEMRTYGASGESMGSGGSNVIDAVGSPTGVS